MQIRPVAKENAAVMPATDFQKMHRFRRRMPVGRQATEDRRSDRPSGWNSWLAFAISEGRQAPRRRLIISSRSKRWPALIDRRAAGYGALSAVPALRIIG